MAKRRELFRGSAISRRYRYFPEFKALSSGPHSRQYRISRAGTGRISGYRTYRDLPLRCEFLGWGRRARSDVREASLKQHFKFDDVRTHHARTIQDAALHLEMADTMLVDHLAKIFKCLLSSVLCELCFLLWCHRLFELSEIPTHLCVKFLGVEWNMYIEINPFRFRFRSEAAANKVNFCGDRLPATTRHDFIGGGRRCETVPALTRFGREWPRRHAARYADAAQIADLSEPGRRSAQNAFFRKLAGRECVRSKCYRSKE
jgi:hypothetical protein